MLASFEKAGGRANSRKTAGPKLQADQGHPSSTLLSEKGDL